MVFQKTSSPEARSASLIFEYIQIDPRIKDNIQTHRQTKWWVARKRKTPRGNKTALEEPQNIQKEVCMEHVPCR